jgi:hypothetical protein
MRSGAYALARGWRHYNFKSHSAGFGKIAGQEWLVKPGPSPRKRLVSNPRATRLTNRASIRNDDSAPLTFYLLRAASQLLTRRCPIDCWSAPTWPMTPSCSRPLSPYGKRLMPVATLAKSVYSYLTAHLSLSAQHSSRFSISSFFLSFSFFISL